MKLIKLDKRKIITSLIVFSMLSALFLMIYSNRVSKALDFDDITVLNDIEKSAYLDRDYLEKIDTDLEEVEISYIKEEKSWVETNYGRGSETKLYFTNNVYKNIMKQYQVRGRFLEEDDYNTAIISDDLAVYLFGNENCIDEKIYLNADLYTIVGIYKNEMTDEKSMYTQSGENFLVDNVYIVNNSKSTVAINNLIENYLLRDSIYNNKKSVIHMNRYSDTMVNKIYLLCYLVFLNIILILTIAIYKKITTKSKIMVISTLAIIDLLMIILYIFSIINNQKIFLNLHINFEITDIILGKIVKYNDMSVKGFITAVLCILLLNLMYVRRGRIKL